MDLLHTVVKWAEHNRWLVLSLVVALALSSWIIGCQPKTTSLLDPDKQVPAATLEREAVVIEAGLAKQVATLRQLEAAYNADVVKMNASIEMAQADIKRQVELRLKFIEVLGGIGSAVASGGLTAPAAVGSAVQVLTLLAAGGLAFDTRRKSKVIGELKNDNPEGEPGSS